MSAFATDPSATDPFAPSPFRAVAIDVYTAAYRVSGETSTRFGGWRTSSTRSPRPT